MIRHSFPDLAWLQHKVQGCGRQAAGWPNVVLNVQSSGCYRPAIRGPLSLFLNIKGQSRCAVASHAVNIPESHYFITNPGDVYTLALPANQITETFNLHVGEHFLEQVYDGLVRPADKLLDDPFAVASSPICFFNRLYPKDATLQRLLHQVYQHAQTGVTNKLLLEEQLAPILVYLLQVHRSVLKQAQQLPGSKRATQREIYKRLGYSIDFLQTYYNQEITLDALSQVACLSKFHYLRSFKTCFGQTPHQYLTALRVNKAKNLLKHSNLPVTEIARAVGLQHTGSFSRLFRQIMATTAVNYRRQQP